MTPRLLLIAAALAMPVAAHAATATETDRAGSPAGQNGVQLAQFRIAETVEEAEAVVAEAEAQLAAARASGRGIERAERRLRLAQARLAKLLAESGQEAPPREAVPAELPPQAAPAELPPIIAPPERRRREAAPPPEGPAQPVPQRKPVEAAAPPPQGPAQTAPRRKPFEAAAPQERDRRRLGREGGRDAVVVEEAQDDRVIIRTDDNQVVIRHDEDRRFRRRGDRVDERRRADGSTVTEVTRRDGSKVITVTDADGNIVRRVRRTPDGRVVVLIGGPDDFRQRRPRAQTEEASRTGRRFDFDRTLPPLRLRIPREEYIVEARRSSRRAMTQALAAPPVEVIERPYTLDEIRYSHRLRDKVRRVDLDTITFEFGSAAVPDDQVGAMTEIGEALADLVADNPDTVLLIEGHTDAVGTDYANLLLSDRRAESVAIILTDYFGIPPENLITQGYGEQYLKIPTEVPERANRRVTVRNLTPLLQGQAGR